MKVTQRKIKLNNRRKKTAEIKNTIAKRRFSYSTLRKTHLIFLQSIYKT